MRYAAFATLASTTIKSPVSKNVLSGKISGVPCGAESGHGYKNLHAGIKNFYALPYSVFEIKDYEAKYYSILRIAMELNITVVASLNPSTIILLCQKICLRNQCGLF